MAQVKTGLALGGGGARGFAHIGVLQVFQEAGITIDYLAGTSMGAVVGAMYAENLDAFQVENRWKKFVQSDTYRQIGIPQLVTTEEKETGFWDQITSEIRERMAMNMARSRRSIIKSDRLTNAIKALITNDNFSRCRIPLTVLATDLLTGNDVPISSGDLHWAVTASASIPGFLPPVESDGKLLSDGGISCPVPVQYAGETESTVIIGVGVPPPSDYPAMPENAVDVINRAEQITSLHYTKKLMESADFQIYPELENVHWYEFERMEEIIAAGREKTEQLLPDIRKHLKKKVSWWQRL